MKKLGVILDSSCGLSKKEAEEKGFMFLPIVIEFDGEERLAGVDIDNEFLYNNMSIDKKVRTAAIRLGDIEKTFKEASEKYEKVLFLSLSKHLSSINSTAKKMAEEISDNIVVYDSEFVTPWLLYLIPKMIKILENDGTLEEMIKLIDLLKGEMFGYVIPGTLEYLHRGGRITKAQYLAGSLLKIFPIVKVDNGSLSDSDIIKGRTISKTLDKMVDRVLKERDEIIANNGNIEIQVLNINAGENYNLLLEKLSNKGVDVSKIVTTFLTSEIIAHIGPNALGLGVIKVID